MEEQAKRIAQLLKTLSNEHRLLVLCALMKGPMTVGELHEFTPNITLSALSQHLSHLRTAGILDCEKRGMSVVYWIADTRVVTLMGAIKQEYCP